jgi:hypothetical protein
MAREFCIVVSDESVELAVFSDRGRAAFLATDDIVLFVEFGVMFGDGPRLRALATHAPGMFRLVRSGVTATGV